MDGQCLKADSETPLIVLVQGANLKTLGTREHALYGSITAPELEQMLKTHAKEQGCVLRVEYADDETQFVAALQAASKAGVDGILINPGALTESSMVIAPLLGQLGIPIVEVHLTNLAKRGLQSQTAAKATAVIMGLGIYSYFLGLDGLLNALRGTR